MSFFTPSLRDALRVPITQSHMDLLTMFVSYILPPVIGFFIMAVLAVTPQTHAARIALWPIITFLALRTVILVDFLGDKPEQKLANGLLACFMFDVVIRSFDWMLVKDPLVRHLRPAKGPLSTIIDAIDLTTNIRGIGWNWSHGVPIPHETRPKKRMPFIFWTLFSSVVHCLASGICQKALLSFVGIRPTAGGWTIFDASLPFLPRYLRSSVISVLLALATYASLQTFYNATTVAAILLLGQDPVQWPPAFDAPWCATSLHDFWGRRWHQWRRQVFLVLGGYPLSIFFGSAGIVLGAFLASAVLHDVIVVRVNPTTSAWWMLVGFGMMGPGLLLERAFRVLTGRRVEGVLGWTWTMAWMVLFGNVIVEGFARAGGFGEWTAIDGVPRLRDSVDGLVAGFDVWLRNV